MKITGERKILECCGVAQDFNNWNDLKKKFEMRNTGLETPPCGLVEAALLRFEGFCEDYFIDASKYPFIRISSLGPSWQVDFHIDKNATGPNVSVFDIGFNDERKEIVASSVGVY